MHFLFLLSSYDIACNLLEIHFYVKARSQKQRFPAFSVPQTTQLAHFSLFKMKIKDIAEGGREREGSMGGGGGEKQENSNSVEPRLSS